MKKIQYKCKLLSDIILNQKAATEGRVQTLDFIPGSNFLGIAATIYGELKANEPLLVFHSGKVRFGDAHPGEDSKRALRVPASFLYPKLLKPEDELFVHHAISDFDKLAEKQLKQCRKGFYVFHDEKALEVKVEHNFAIKSAYDRDKRRSEDEKMYGYQSIGKGVEMYFEITYDNDVPQELITKLNNALTGIKRVGRSRTAQFGLVNISKKDYLEVPSNPTNNNELIIYADGRLIFLDEFGHPTFTPKPQSFGLKKGEIDWSESQIRTFQYAPWNFIRGRSDTDRCGIEKGSVIVVKGAEFENDLKEYVGCYQNEGFGKVIYNPAFLQAKEGENGRAVWKVVKEENPPKNDAGNDLKLTEVHHPLATYLRKQKKEQETETLIYAKVNEFVEKKGHLFRGKAFASQWGNIRTLAIQYPQKKKLKVELFTKEVADKDGKMKPFAYLTHGVAKEKWEERKRIDVFKDFFEKLPEEDTQFAVVNLAAEMAKLCRREK